MIINTNIKSGKDTFSNLDNYLKELKYKIPLVIVDKNLYDNSDYVKNSINKIVKNSLFF